MRVQVQVQARVQGMCMEAGSAGFPRSDELALGSEPVPWNKVDCGSHPTTPCKCGVRWWVPCSAAANNAVTTALIEFTPLTAESHVACCMLHGVARSCCSCCSMLLDAAGVGEVTG